MILRFTQSIKYEPGSIPLFRLRVPYLTDTGAKKGILFSPILSVSITIVLSIPETSLNLVSMVRLGKGKIKSTLKW
jgi:hypothetical protein